MTDVEARQPAEWEAAKAKVLDGFESYDGVEGDGSVDALIAVGDALVSALQAVERERDELKRSNFKLRAYADYEYVADADLKERATKAEARLQAVEEALRKIQAVVNDQAEDEALWAIYPRGTQPIAEAYLQQELRRLHEVVESASVERGTG